VARPAENREPSTGETENRKMVTTIKDQIVLNVEGLEKRIAPRVNGAGGYDGQLGNQCSAANHPSGSANPEDSANS
jgi:hypothetical protein